MLQVSKGLSFTFLEQLTNSVQAKPIIVEEPIEPVFENITVKVIWPEGKRIIFYCRYLNLFSKLKVFFAFELVVAVVVVINGIVVDKDEDSVFANAC